MADGVDAAGDGTSPGGFPDDKGVGQEAHLWRGTQPTHQAPQIRYELRAPFLGPLKSGPWQVFDTWAADTAASAHNRRRLRRSHFLALKDLMQARGELYEKCRRLISINLNELFYTSGLAAEVPHKREWWLGQLLRLYNDDVSRVLVAAWRRLMPNPLATYMLVWQERCRENETLRETVQYMGYQQHLRDGRRYLVEGRTPHPPLGTHHSLPHRQAIASKCGFGSCDSRSTYALG